MSKENTVHQRRGGGISSSSINHYSKYKSTQSSEDSSWSDYDEAQLKHYQQQSSSGIGSAAAEHIADLLSLKKRKDRIREKARRQSYYLSTWFFLKILSIVFFVAFFSSYLQVKGLIGEDGILPVNTLLERQQKNLMASASPSSTNEINSIWILLTHPTNGFGISVNNTLYLMCVLGLVFSSLSLFTTPIATYIGFMWFLYYCIVDVGQIFYSYQWDQLLLETSFLAIFLSPFTFKYDDKPSTPIRYLLKWLVFRLIFGSGIIKLTPIWSSFKAMSFHYETQCIPNIISYYVHQFPNYYHQFETMMTLVIEILVTPFFFAPRVFKITACLINILLQICIILTGNYNFFNYLTIALLLMLLDDSFILSACSVILPSPFYQYIRMLEYNKTTSARQDREKRNKTDIRFTLSNINSKNLLIPFIFILVGMSTLYASTRYLQRQSVPTIIQRVHSALDFYHITGTYGLFSHVTTERFELSIEGSYDGIQWYEYEFYYKPGNLSRAPPLVFPGHNPRLDWQMWFAGISDPRTQGWIVHFMAKLLEGSPEVLSLIDYSPFPLDNPPKYIKANKFKYQFTKWKTSDQWWEREFVDHYILPFELDSPSYKYFLQDSKK
ncbi:putative transmembrane protein [Cavenderia fasciculata]|uniref:Lipase maturation factor 2 n=1 Tax=Cavenderia fasciculata TaxID=261658 RepID=F4Q4V3_CACFS|nr:putative transmembrane protein [Cavenderia fasciculata]EGG17899.1 putative transmembrane protein [Cavenderia fasciculata]|eukprot:XP_004356383.1 putative transmembrane protein [Cavenderia fasciculata]